MSKARTLANLISDNAELADGQISVAEVVGAAPLASPTFTGTASGTFSGPLTGNVTGNVTGNLTGNVTGDVAGDIDLSAIAATISDTAVDIFVYDTSKDSDGGAWRKRTQGTSWYNETLNTATRGSRKEFPAVAVIVAEAGAVTIYDGDDPDLPMWMVFPEGRILAQSGTYPTTGVTALNGTIAVSKPTYGVSHVNFISERAVWYHNGAQERLYLEPISGRGSSSGGTFTTDATPIVNNEGNDVAMTVLPNAPIDAATGLPVPTIAVATDGGVSVIKDDGTVVDLTRSGSPMATVDFHDGYLTFGSSSVGAVWYYDYIPSADEAVSPNDGHVEYYDSGFANKASPSYLGYTNTVTAGSYVGTTGNNDSGLTAVDFNATDYTKSSTAFITSSYNTGWMNGDIKLATLSDTDDTDVTGSELVTNGTFDSNTTGWTTPSATSSVTSGAATFTDTNGGGYAYQEISTTIGKTYTLRYDTTGSREAYFQIKSGGVNGTELATTSGFNGTRTGTFAITFVAQQTNTFIRISDGSGTAFSITVDNISVRLAEEDRSVNGNGLQVFGTVPKVSVATGSDLVAYGSFSDNIYLEQPYNSDLDFGTGDFCVMLWVNVNSGFAATDYIFSRGTHLGYALNASGSGYNFYADGTNIGVTGLQTGVWQFICCGVRSGQRFISLNAGEEQTSAISTSVDEADATLIIGNYSAGSTAFFNGLVSLFRISATAPSPEQIARIYNDEKHLFTEDAQATLYGSSDAVTALAYDDSTELLHVGTSAGRSDFQGLRRVNNTTNAVGAAISASNGLIAED